MRGRFSVVVMLVAVAGCDSNPKGGSCGGPDPCGGDVVGNWKIVDSCVDYTVPPIDSDFCPQATGTVSNFALSGGVAYNADLSYSATLTAAVTIVIRYPTACFTMDGVTTVTIQDSRRVTIRSQITLRTITAEARMVSAGEALRTGACRQR